MSPIDPQLSPGDTVPFGTEPTFVVPGTSVTVDAHADVGGDAGPKPLVRRDSQRRALYAEAALARIPHLLGMIDRNPYRETYGCMDRAYWHYRTSDFPSGMYQEGVWPLALVYRQPLPGNKWLGCARVRELAIAGIRFAARSSHRDGSCDDYYPFERALGATAFSLLAAVNAHQLLELDDAEVRRWMRRRAEWLARHDESGRLSNHHAITALALAHIAHVCDIPDFLDAADRAARRVHAWQSPEGWFDEYGGADPGYQTVTIDALVKYRRLTGADWLDEPILRAVRFARWFLHPDGSFGGEYGSRGTYHFYPHAFELLSSRVAAAADLADGFLESLSAGTQAYFDDDRMFIHRLGNLMEAYRDWSLERATSDEPTAAEAKYFPRAQILIDRNGPRQTVISASRGGVIKNVAVDQPPWTDAGLILETTKGRIAVSQMHAGRRVVHYENPRADTDCSARSEAARESSESQVWQLEVEGPLHWAALDVASPWTFAILRISMATFGRFARGVVRRLLQRRVVTGQREAPIRLGRTITRIRQDAATGDRLRIEDQIRLIDPQLAVRRASFGSDHEVRYTAAANVYQQSVLQGWYHLDEGDVECLNQQRRLTIVREIAL